MCEICDHLAETNQGYSVMLVRAWHNAARQVAYSDMVVHGVAFFDETTGLIVPAKDVLKPEHRCHVN